MDRQQMNRADGDGSVKTGPTGLSQADSGPAPKNSTTERSSLRIAYVNSPIGRLRISSSGRAITEAIFVDDRPDGAVPPAKTQPASDSNADPLIALTGEQLAAYFAGTLREFDLPLEPGGTEFQQSVWRALRQIGYGETAAYREIAQMLGKPNAVRAVGAANGQNPISIIVPCHRIIGSDGALTGYGGGLWRKEWLLRHEGAILL